MPKAKSSRHLSAGATAAVSSHAHKLWDKLEALTAPVEPSLSEAQPKVVSFSLDQPTPELPMATSDQESWAMQNEADSNVLHAWLVAAQSQVAVLSRHRLQEHASRTEAERHKQNADELERRHLGLLREHARLAHQMRTQLEAAERRALDAEESAGRMDEERHQWRARVSVLEEKVAGLTSALKTARIKRIVTARRFIDLGKFEELAASLAQVCELVWQLRGQAEGRQIENAKLGITANQGLFGHGSSVIVGI